jgi:hypothetical protein
MTGHFKGMGKRPGTCVSLPTHKGIIGWKKISEKINKENKEIIDETEIRQAHEGDSGTGINGSHGVGHGWVGTGTARG